LKNDHTPVIVLYMGLAFWSDTDKQQCRAVRGGQWLGRDLLAQHLRHAHREHHLHPALSASHSNSLLPLPATLINGWACWGAAPCCCQAGRRMCGSWRLSSSCDIRATGRWVGDWWVHKAAARQLVLWAAGSAICLLAELGH